MTEKKEVKKEKKNKKTTKKKVTKKKEEKKEKSKFLKALYSYGAKIVKKHEEKKYPYIIPFNHYGLNAISGGGIIGGCSHEISGLSATSKSFILYELGSVVINKMNGYFFLIDAEQAYTQSYGDKVDLIPDGKHFAIAPINSMEDAFSAMKSFIKYIRIDLKDTKSPILCGIDSYAGLRINLDLENDEAMKDPIGYMNMQTPLKWNELIIKMNKTLEKYEATLVTINQLTTKYTDSPRGKIAKKQSLNEDKMAYMSTQRFRGTLNKIDGADGKITKNIASISKYKKGNGKDGKTGVKKQIGVWVTWETIKNRLQEPFQKVETRILYRSGLKKYSGLAELLVNRGYIKLGTKTAFNKEDKKLKTPIEGFKLVDDKDSLKEFFEIGPKKENHPTIKIELAVKKVIEAHPEFLKPEYYEFSRDAEEAME